MDQQQSSTSNASNRMMQAATADASATSTGGATTIRGAAAATASAFTVRALAPEPAPAAAPTEEEPAEPPAPAPKSTILSASYDLEALGRQFRKLYPGLRGQYNLELVQCSPYLLGDEKESLRADYSAVFKALKWTEVAYTSRLETLVPASRTPFKDCITFCWYVYTPYSKPGSRMRALYQNVLFRDSATWYMTNKHAMLRRLLLFEASARAAVASGLVDEGPCGGAINCASFIPRTLIYSQGREAAVAAAMATDDDGAGGGCSFIVKPAAGLQGRGIELYRGGPPSAAKFASFMLHHYGDEARSNSFYVVQRYVQRPLLIDGRKFDLRVYLLVVPNMNCCASCDSNASLRGFYGFYHPGFARLSCLDYGDGSSSDRRVHLTNCCVQDGSSGAEGSGVGSARASSSCCDLLKDVNWTPDQVNEYFNGRFDQGLDGIPRRDWFKTTLQADLQGILALVLTQFSRQLCSTGEAGNAFKLLGCDFLVDAANLRPWLLELNSMPSLRVRSPCQRAVKTPMQREALALAVEVAHRSANGLPVTSRCLAMRRNFRLVFSATNAKLQGGLVKAFWQRLG